jgi:hypothetical protein
MLTEPPVVPWLFQVLRQMGLKEVAYLVPNRFEFGYGLTPEIVELAAAQMPDLIVTVDNGISSIEGVSAAQALGISVSGDGPSLARRDAADCRCHRESQSTRLSLPE